MVYLSDRGPLPRKLGPRRLRPSFRPGGELRNIANRELLLRLRRTLLLQSAVDDERWPANPVLGAQELLRFSRISSCFPHSAKRGKNMTNPSKVLRDKNRIRKPVHPSERVPLKLSNRQRELILNTLSPTMN